MARERAGNIGEDMSVSLSVSVVIDTAILDGLVAAAPGKAKAAVLQGAYMIEADAKQLAPVDTGALRNSIESEQGEGISAVVHDGVEYGIWQELGTSKMAAQPFMIPALEKNAGAIRDLLARVITA